MYIGRDVNEFKGGIKQKWRCLILPNGKGHLRRYGLCNRTSFPLTTFIIIMSRAQFHIRN